MIRPVQTVLAVLGALVVLGSSSVAHAMTCDQIVGMVNVPVPTSIIVKAIADEGAKYTEDDVKCVRDRGAPEEVVTQVKAQVPPTPPPPPAPPPPPPPPPPAKRK